MAELRTDYLANLGLSYGKGMDLASQMQHREKIRKIYEDRLTLERQKRQDAIEKAKRDEQAQREGLIIRVADAASKIYKVAGKKGLHAFAEATSGLPGMEWMKDVDPEDFEIQEGKTLYHVKDPDGNYIGSLVITPDGIKQFKKGTASKNKPTYKTMKGDSITLPGGQVLKAPSGMELEVTFDPEDTSGATVARGLTRKKGDKADLGDEFKTSEAEKIEKYTQEYIVSQMFRGKEGESEGLDMFDPKEYLGVAGMGMLQQREPRIAQMITDVSRMAKEIFKDKKKSGGTPQSAVMEAYEEYFSRIKGIIESSVASKMAAIPKPSPAQPKQVAGGDNDPLELWKKRNK